MSLQQRTESARRHRGAQSAELERSSTPQPPSVLLRLLEIRALAELGAYALSYPLLRLTPRGDGHPVVILPPLGANDLSTVPLRTFLRGRGYAAHGWGEGKNVGPVSGLAVRLRQRLADIRGRYDRTVTLIGWSLGGIYARELAKVMPEHVRQVITLCSPFAGDPRASNAARTYRRLSGQSEAQARGDRKLHEPPPVPTTAIYSRSDGIVAWQGCVEPSGPQCESIAVPSSHFGVGHHPLALYAIADRLAQPEDGWRPFDPSGLKRFIYSAPPHPPRWSTRTPAGSPEQHGA